MPIYKLLKTADGKCLCGGLARKGLDRVWNGNRVIGIDIDIDKDRVVVKFGLK